VKPEKPSNASLTLTVIASLVSMLVTVTFLFVAVLPAIYGIDPTGLGKALGINGLLPQPNQATSAQVQTQSDNIKPAQTNNAPPVVSAESLPEERKDNVTLVIPPKQELNYRLFMERDYALDYSWATDGKPIYTELRGERITANKNEIKNFAKITDNKAKGFFMIPFAGNFGWHWENKSDQAITVRLTTKGAYKILG
jgi:hypothetical protein